MRGDPDQGHARRKRIKQTVDYLQIAWPAARRADGELSPEMDLGSGGERGDLIAPEMDPFDLSLTADNNGQTAHTITDDGINALDARDNKRIDDLIDHDVRH
jgi:hypothetical protein